VKTHCQTRFFYGHVLVLAGFFIMLLIYGTLYSFGVFLKPLLAEPGWTRPSVLGAYSLCFFLSGALATAAGWLTDRLGPRFVISCSGILIGSGYLLVSCATTVTDLYLYYGLLVGAGMSGGIAPILSTITRWFSAKRGLMAGFVVAGVGTGTLVVPPIATALIFAFGWRASCRIFGITLLVFLAGLAQLFLSDPSRKGLTPFGSQQTPAGPDDPQLEGLSLRHAFRTRQLWILIALYICAGFFIQIALVNTTIYAISIGAPEFWASALVSLMGFGSVAGRVGGGFASDRLGLKPVVVAACLMMAVQFGGLLVSDNLWVLFIFAAFFGITYGEILCAMPLLPAELFGMRHHGALLGLITFASTLGGGLGPVVAGHIVDSGGGYAMVWMACMAAGLAASGLSISLKTGNEPSQRPGSWPDVSRET